MSNLVTINLPVRGTDGILKLYNFKVARQLFEDAAARYDFLVSILASEGVPPPSDIELVPTSVERDEYIGSEEYQAQ